ncbi:MAG: hypothetical protein M1828_005904 [Chrysothrix sp. TS-e1954]|nr:MAG: hypothetical protein M1828_005904 [Chrysothrix sp. TS-e1954]
MPGLSAVVRSVSLRCSGTSHRPFGLPCSRVLAGFSTSSAVLLRSHNQRLLNKSDNSDDGDDDGARKIQTQSWRSLLKTQSLGRPTSVIVLRDSEERRWGDRAVPGDDVGVQRVLLKDVNADELLEAVETHRNAPGQEEVNAAIEDIRHASLQLDGSGTSVLTKDGYEQVALELAESFNQLQLSRYISIQEGNRLLNAKQPSSKQSQTSPRIRTSDWIPHSDVEQQSFRGKAALIQIIVKRIWGVGIQEEIEKDGTLELTVNSRNVTLLMSGGNTSTLSRIGGSNGIIIRTARANNVLDLIGSKRACEAAADTIENQLNGLYEEEFDFKPFKGPPKSALTIQHAVSVAEASNCAIETLKGAQAILIRAKSKAGAERCRRELVASASMPTRVAKKNVFHPADDTSGMSWTSDLASEPSQHERHRLYSGRFALLGKVAKGVNGAGLKVKDNPVTSEAQGTSLTFLDDVSNQDISATFTSAEEVPELSASLWQSKARSTYLATFGDFYRLGYSPLPHSLSTAEAAGDSSHLPLFRPSTVGLSNYLAQQHPDKASRAAQCLTVSLIPSPWSHWGTDALNHCPPLELVFRVDEASQRLALESVSAVPNQREADMLLPAFASDLRVSREDRLRVADPHQSDALTAYVKAIESSAGGYGQIGAPQYLNLYTPVSLLSHVPPRRKGQHQVTLSEDKTMMKMQYFTSALSYTQTLTWSLDAYDLVVTRSTAGESLSLRATPERAREAWSQRVLDGVSSTDVDAEKDTSTESRQQAFTAEYKRAFMQKAADIASSISAGLGRDLTSQRVLRGDLGYSGSSLRQPKPPTVTDLHEPVTVAAGAGA